MPGLCREEVCYGLLYHKLAISRQNTLDAQAISTNLGVVLQ